MHVYNFNDRFEKELKRMDLFCEYVTVIEERNKQVIEMEKMLSDIEGLFGRLPSKNDGDADQINALYELMTMEGLSDLELEEKDDTQDESAIDTEMNCS
jgi:hypothetical protein